ncbi:SGNH/GDSL hydrolase family protein [Alsobacter sp. SYSU BS001988]
MRKAGIWAAAGALLASAWGAQAQTPRIVAFGDSLSDPGNLFIATGGTTPPNPYDQGRFSNGLTWVERLSGAPLNFFTFAAGRPGSVDFAFGGARTDTTVANPPGIPDQIASYLSRGGTFGSSDLVTLWGGANNIFQALAAPSPTLASLGAASTGGAGALAGSVQALAAAGARNIVVLNLPDLGLTPSFLNTAGQAGATYASAAFNQQLAASLAAVKAANPGVSIIQVDAKSIFDLVAASPGAFGVANSSAACLATPSCVAAPAAVQNGFAFWDGVHPTAAGHELIARLALEYLNAPVSAAGLSGMADVALMDRRDAAARAFGRFDRIRLGLQQPDGVYAEALGGRLEAGQDGGRPGYSSNRAGLAAGVTHAFTPNYAVGLEA